MFVFLFWSSKDIKYLSTVNKEYEYKATLGNCHRVKVGSVPFIILVTENIEKFKLWNRTYTHVHSLNIKNFCLVTKCSILLSCYTFLLSVWSRKCLQETVLSLFHQLLTSSLDTGRSEDRSANVRRLLLHICYTHSYVFVEIWNLKVNFIFRCFLFVFRIVLNLVCLSLEMNYSSKLNEQEGR